MKIIASRVFLTVGIHKSKQPALINNFNTRQQRTRKTPKGNPIKNLVLKRTNLSLNSLMVGELRSFILNYSNVMIQFEVIQRQKISFLRQDFFIGLPPGASLVRRQ